MYSFWFKKVVKRWRPKRFGIASDISDRLILYYHKLSQVLKFTPIITNLYLTYVPCLRV
jgi:hypothetical protein